MEIVVRKQKDIDLFQIKGRLDARTSLEFEKTLIGAIQMGSNRMILDFENLDHISSAGLRVILRATKELKPSKGVLILCSMKDYIEEVFQVSGFDSFLPIEKKPVSFGNLTGR
jgi:anti-sigma B factor antagonist